MGKGVCWITLPGAMLHKGLEEKSRSFDDMPSRNAAYFFVTLIAVSNELPGQASMSTYA